MTTYTTPSKAALEAARDLAWEMYDKAHWLARDKAGNNSMSVTAMKDIAATMVAFAAAEAAETAKLREALEKLKRAAADAAVYADAPKTHEMDDGEAGVVCAWDVLDQLRYDIAAADAALSTTPATPAASTPTVEQVVSTISRNWSSDTKTATAEAVMALFGAPAEQVAVSDGGQPISTAPKDGTWVRFVRTGAPTV